MLIWLKHHKMSHLAWDESQRLDSIKSSYAKLIETKPLKNEWWVEIKSNLLAMKSFLHLERAADLSDIHYS